MFHQFLVDLVLVAHFLFIAFVVLGGLLTLRWPWMPWVHLPAVSWGAGVELFGWFCPLTQLENYLRRAGGDAAYAGSFIERYLLPIIYPEQLTSELQLMLLGLLVICNLVVYVLVYVRRRR